MYIYIYIYIHPDNILNFDILDTKEEYSCCYSYIQVIHFRYKRIFSIGSMGITTYNPSTLEVTNKWEYSDFISVQPINRNQLSSHEFTITVRKERKNETMKFSSEHRPHLLTEALKYRNQVERSREILVSLHIHVYFLLFLSLLFLSTYTHLH